MLLLLAAVPFRSESVFLCRFLPLPPPPVRRSTRYVGLLSAAAEPPPRRSENAFTSPSRASLLLAPFSAAARGVERTDDAAVARLPRPLACGVPPLPLPGDLPPPRLPLAPTLALAELLGQFSMPSLRQIFLKNVRPTPIASAASITDRWNSASSCGRAGGGVSSAALVFRGERAGRGRRAGGPGSHLTPGHP